MAGKRPPNAARSARQRPITCPTGSSLQSPRLSGRVVMPATTPYRWAHSASSRRGTAASPAGTSARDGTGAACSAPASCAPDLSAPLNLRPQRSQPVVDVLVAPLDLPDVLDHRIALRRERGQQHRHAGADVGTLDLLPAQRRGPRDHGAMRIAQNDARTHTDQLVDEKQPRLEQLFEHEQQSFALGRHDDGDGHEVRRKRGPRSVFELGDVTAQIGTDAALLAGIDDEFGAVEPRPDAEALEREQSRPKVVAAHAVDRDRTARDGRESDERADLDVIGADGVGRGRRRERRATLDREGVGADAIDGIGTNTLTIEGRPSLTAAPPPHTVGPDHIEIGSFIGLAAVTGGAITIDGVRGDDLRSTLLAFERLGVRPRLDGAKLIVDAGQERRIRPDLGGHVPKLEDGPWPAFPADLMSIAIVVATQCEGLLLVFEKLFESRLFFVDKLIGMGARIVLCDPHRAVIAGPSALRGQQVESPDIRAGMAMLLAALAAQGDSVIQNIGQIERGYEHIDDRLRALGAQIERRG